MTGCLEDIITGLCNVSRGGCLCRADIFGHNSLDLIFANVLSWDFCFCCSLGKKMLWQRNSEAEGESGFDAKLQLLHRRKPDWQWSTAACSRAHWQSMWVYCVSPPMWTLAETFSYIVHISASQSFQLLLWRKPMAVSGGGAAAFGGAGLVLSLKPTKICSLSPHLFWPVSPLAFLACLGPTALNQRERRGYAPTNCVQLR